MKGEVCMKLTKKEERSFNKQMRELERDKLRGRFLPTGWDPLEHAKREQEKLEQEKKNSEPAPTVDEKAG
jgi:hypothetical protein